jgi:hypothetical protein
MEKQDWQGKHLDKDILKNGNRVYCKEFCAFVTPKTNIFFSSKKDCDGVSLIRSTGRYRARCQNPITGERIHIGVFADESDAVDAYSKVKREQFLSLSKIESDKRVSNALLSFYAGISYD